MSLQSFRTLCNKVTEELQNQLSDKDKKKSVENNQQISDIEIKYAIEEIENVNNFPHYIEALIERILDIKVAKNVEVESNKISKKWDHDPINLDRLILNIIFNQTPDLSDKNNFK